MFAMLFKKTKNSICYSYKLGQTHAVNISRDNNNVVLYRENK